MIKKTLLTLVSTLLTSLVAAQDGQEELAWRFEQNLSAIQSVFEVRYAPMDWKEELFGFSLVRMFEEARISALDNSHLSLGRCRSILRKAMKDTRDYHVGITFFATEASFLPFRVKSSEGRYYIAFVDQEAMNSFELPLPIEVGDELLLFDGRAVGDVVEAIAQQEFSSVESATDRSLAEYSLTSRSARLGQHVPSGPLSLTLAKRGTGDVLSLETSWCHWPEEITSPFECTWSEKTPKGKSIADHPIFHRDRTATAYHNYQADKASRKKWKQKHLGKRAEEEEKDNWLGSYRSFMPELGEVEWRSDSQLFYAYIFTDFMGRKIGCVRIPNYVYGEEGAENFAEIIDYMQQKTEALIIDQNHNSGGSLFYMYALLSMLTDRPLEVPLDREVLLQESVHFALEYGALFGQIDSEQLVEDLFGETLDGYCVDLDFVRGVTRYCQEIVTTWQRGGRMTDPIPLYGLTHIQPHPHTRYTKPIVLLVNELAFSCGDFFPAIMQDNGRALVVGQTTAGAGGYVTGYAFPNLFGIEQVRMTGSIAFRTCGLPIENLGITPDVALKPTARDLQGSYCDYKEGVIRALHHLITPEALPVSEETRS